MITFQNACLAFTVAATIAGQVAPAAARSEGIIDIARVRAETPTCAANPGAPWIGRVSGQMTGLLDRSISASFVGCFETRQSCERWKGRASGIIDRRIIQYSCRPRF